MTSRVRSSAGDTSAAFVSWLVTGAVGPALVALPVNLVADKLAGAAVRWFKRLRQTDDLSRLVRAACGASIHLGRDEVSNLRALLTREQTWRMLGGGKLNEKLRDLIAQIAGCLPLRDGRTAEDAREAAGAIARGLLEFAVYDLQPDIFQKVVLARLQQITDQASALDIALLRMHKDLYHLADEAQNLFRQVMDRLPPEPADLNDIRIYLKTLISWLNTDPWPRDQRLGGPALTPATIERKLWVSVTAPAPAKDVGEPARRDADELARQCERLVILGGPGSGKTWLAKRTARICAEKALQALSERAVLDEVELPLYTTCSRLVSTSGGIRKAAVSSAIERIGDLGGSRIIDALCLFFSDRDSRTLLVIDSLDEASNSDEVRDRLREADSLRSPWRIVLTSRRSSWDNQLNLEKGQNHRVGELLPLRYPDDVEAVIQQWFADKPERGQALAGQIAERPSLQQDATVPLILAFYCIIGGQQPLPLFRHVLYRQVISRMLHAPWRSSSGSPPDPEDCWAALRTWAWRGAKDDPFSGVGKWEDDIPTKPAHLSPAGQNAVDHIAEPGGLPGFDTDEIARRFIHRSIQEHLVAEYVASLPADQALQKLLPHLWYDPEWEYAAPAAIAMHDQRDQLLGALLRGITMSGRIPDDVSGLDTGWEIRKLLARVAAESSKDDWSPAIAAAIAQARLQLARSGRTGELAGAWESSNRQVREVLLAQLATQDNVWADKGAAGRLAGAIARLKPAPEDRHRARETLLRLLSGFADYAGLASELVGGVIQLTSTAHDKRQARTALLELLASSKNSDWAATLVNGIVKLAATAHDQRRTRAALLGLLVHQHNGWVAAKLAVGVIQLTPTAHDKRQVRAALLGLLAYQVDGFAAINLADTLTRTAPTPQDMRQTRDALLSLLTSQTDYRAVTELMGAVIQLSPTAHDKRQARYTLLSLLDSQTHLSVAAELVHGVIQLAPTAHDRRQARDALLELLAGQASDVVAAALVRGITELDSTTPDEHRGSRARETLLTLLAAQTDPYGGPMAATLADGVVYLAATGHDRRWARQALLRLLATQDSDGVAAAMVDGLNRLALTAKEKRETCKALLGLLPGHANFTVARRLVYGLAKFTPTAQDRRQACVELLGLLARPADNSVFAEMVDQVVWLALSAQYRRPAREALLKLLADQASGMYRCLALAGGLARLAPTAGQRRRARETLLGLLAEHVDSFDAACLADGLAQLAVTAQQKRQASALLVRLLLSETNSWISKHLASSLVQVEPETRYRHQALDALVESLADDSDYSWDGHPANGFVRLAVTAEDKRHTREVLVVLLTNHDNVWAALRLADGLTRLAPAARDKRLAREALLKLLRHHLQSHAGTELMDRVIQLAPTARDKRQAREVLLGLLADQVSNWHGSDWEAKNRVAAVVRLAPTAQDRCQARDALLVLLTREIEDILVPVLVSGVVQLAPTMQDKRQARQVLLGLLDEESSDKAAEELLTRLDPTVDDLIALTECYIRPSAELLAAARRNSPFTNWLAAVRGNNSNHNDFWRKW